MLKLTILVEDRNVPGFTAEHGWSVFIEDGAKCILFDTGQSDAFIKNAEKLGIDLARTDIIAISHGHYDHTGGLPSFFRNYGKREPFIHPAAKLAKYSKKYDPAKYIGMPLMPEVNFNETKKIVQISEHVYFLGEISTRSFSLDKNQFYLDKSGEKEDLLYDDTSLVIKGEKGVYLLCGCCHSGLTNTIEQVKEYFSQELLGIIGGFHLMDPNCPELENTFSYLERLRSLEILGIAHCTSKEVGERFKGRFPDIARDFRIGDTFEFTN